MLRDGQVRILGNAQTKRPTRRGGRRACSGHPTTVYITSPRSAGPRSGPPPSAPRPSAARPARRSPALAADRFGRAVHLFQADGLVVGLAGADPIQALRHGLRLGGELSHPPIVVAAVLLQAAENRPLGALQLVRRGPLGGQFGGEFGDDVSDLRRSGRFAGELADQLAVVDEGVAHVGQGHGRVRLA